MSTPHSAQSTSACPTCGQAVEVVTSGEGTSHYVGIDAWDASTLRTERQAAILSATMDLRQALNDASEVIVSAIVMLAGLAEPWDALHVEERCARVENELRGLNDRVSAALDQERQS